MRPDNFPKVSVLMSVYKEPHEWIEEAISSILNQTMCDFEFLIINDNPTDTSLKIFLENQEKKDVRIKVLTNDCNIGLTKSLNIGLKYCTGEYVARMDADDISEPTRFEEQVKFLDSNPKVGIVGSWMSLVGSKKGKVKLPVSNDDIKAYQIFASPFDHPATIMRKSVLDDNGIIYDENLKHAQDQLLWYELSKVCEFANIPKYLFNHRYNDQQISKLHLESQRDTTRKVRRKMVKEVLSKYFFPNVWSEGLTFDLIDKMNRQLKTKIIDKGELKIWNSTVKVLSLTLQNYNCRTLIKFLKSGIYLQTGWTIKDFIRVIYKHINKRYYDSIPMSFD